MPHAPAAQPILWTTFSHNHTSISDVYSVQRTRSHKERDHQADQDVGGWIILKWILEIRLGSMDCIDLAPDWDQWRALVNTAMNLQAS
jgi:hypothetical protein